VGVAQKIGTYFYNPVFTSEQVGTRIVTKDKIVGHTVAKIEQPDGSFVEVREPIIEKVMLEEPVFENVITSYELNAAGIALKTIGSLVPIPGVDETTGGLLGVGGIALLAMERLRRKERKLKKDAEEGRIKAEDATISMQDKFHVAVGGGQGIFEDRRGRKGL